MSSRLSLLLLRVALLPVALPVMDSGGNGLWHSQAGKGRRHVYSSSLSIFHWRSRDWTFFPIDDGNGKNDQHPCWQECIALMKTAATDCCCSFAHIQHSDTDQC